MNTTVQYRTIIGGAVLTLLWICSFLFIKPTLIIDWGGGVTSNFKLVVIAIGLLVVVLYHIFNRPNPETTKLSLTTVMTLLWLALMIFYPFKDPANVTNGYSGTYGFFALISGLGLSVLWVRFFADEIV